MFLKSKNKGDWVRYFKRLMPFLSGSVFFQLDIFMNACWLVAGGLISPSMDKTKGSPCQQGYLESSQAGKMMRYSIPNLPEVCQLLA